MQVLVISLSSSLVLILAFGYKGQFDFFSLGKMSLSVAEIFYKFALLK